MVDLAPREGASIIGIKFTYTIIVIIDNTYTTHHLHYSIYLSYYLAS